MIMLGCNPRISGTNAWCSAEVVVLLLHWLCQHGLELRWVCSGAQSALSACRSCSAAACMNSQLTQLIQVVVELRGEQVALPACRFSSAAVRTAS